MKHTLLALTVTASVLHAQGPLTPPGAPAPTMKTLAQIEARTPIPNPTLATPPFLITQSGSYYLTGNITVSSGDAIRISAEDATLDLNGFTIKSTLTGSHSGSAILVASECRRLTVKNGSIVSGSTLAGNILTAAGFTRGIHFSDATTRQTHINGIHITGTQSSAILTHGLGIIDNCTAYNCGDGIDGQTVTHCIATEILNKAIDGETVSNCKGISENGAAITANTAINCRGNSNTGFGVNAVTATNCQGLSVTTSGLTSTNATNCLGSSTSGTGLSATNAMSCRGSSSSSTGLSTTNATNCTAITTSGSAALVCFGTANTCRAQRNSGVAIDADIAIGCAIISGGGTITSLSKHLGTP